MENTEKQFARVKSPHFDVLFEKQRLVFSEEEIEDLTSEMIDISNDTLQDGVSIDKKIKVVKMIDFAVSVAEHLGMTGSELFSMMLEKERLIKKD